MAPDVLNIASSLIAIGGSAGSLDALLQILPTLKLDNKTAVVIILHRKNDTDSVLTMLLDAKSAYPVAEAEDKESIIAGHIYVAPCDYHLLIEHNFSFSLDDSEKVNFSRPSIDVTFESAAYIFKECLICIILSGANADGTHGMQVAKHLKGRAIAQSPASATIPFMPQQAIDNLRIDAVLTPKEIAPFLSSL